MSDIDRFAAAASTTQSERRRPLVLAGAGLLVVLLAGIWLIFGRDDTGPAATDGLADVQKESYERRITALKEEIDALAAENEKLRSALIKVESELVDYRQRARRQPERVVE